MKPLRKVILTLVIFVLVYSATGVAFHVAWKAERHACDALRRARGGIRRIRALSHTRRGLHDGLVAGLCLGQRLSQQRTVHDTMH